MDTRTLVDWIARGRTDLVTDLLGHPNWKDTACADPGTIGYLVEHGAKVKARDANVRSRCGVG